MARRPSVRYFESRGAYYTQYGGRQHKLAVGPDDAPSGPTYLAALEAFRQLMDLGNVRRAGDANTVQAVLESYLQSAAGRLRKSTLGRRVRVLQPLVDRLGTVPVGKLSHLDLERFFAEQRRARRVKNTRGGHYDVSWGVSTVAVAVQALHAAFAWAVRVKLISANPLDGFKVPPARSRSRDCLVTPEQHRRILATARSPQFRNLLVALENTGARPGELSNATVADFDPALGAVIFYGDDRRREDEGFRHKTAHRRRDRVIRFTGAALDMVRRLAAGRAPGEPLFVSSKGTAYAETSVQGCFRCLRKRLGMPKLSAYSYRHSFATAWLLQGEPIDVLAELLGNSPETIRRHYAHVAADEGAIRRRLEGALARRGGGEGTGSPRGGPGPQDGGR